MFRNMRRSERQLDSKSSENILMEQNHGVLSVHGDGGYPYGVPVNYAYFDGKIYIHGTARESHKADSIRKNGNVCFTVVSEHELEAESFAVNYASVIVFGRAGIIEEKEEILSSMPAVMEGLAPGMEKKAKQLCEQMVDSLIMIEITPEHITGKAGR